ncbi:toxin-antitoxin system HicB family antitoxin [Enterococcus sp. AZ192]
MNKTDKVKFLVSTPADIHAWLKVTAAAKGISVNALVNVILSEKKQQEEN